MRIIIPPTPAHLNRSTLHLDWRAMKPSGSTRIGLRAQRHYLVRSFFWGGGCVLITPSNLYLFPNDANKNMHFSSCVKCFEGFIPVLPTRHRLVISKTQKSMTRWACVCSPMLRARNHARLWRCRDQRHTPHSLGADSLWRRQGKRRGECFKPGEHYTDVRSHWSLFSLGPQDGFVKTSKDIGVRKAWVRISGWLAVTFTVMRSCTAGSLHSTCSMWGQPLLLFPR